MKYIVTGGLGFIGSEICRQLLNKADTEFVWIIDDDSKGYGTTKIQDLYPGDRITWYKQDLSHQSRITHNVDADDWHFDALCKQADHIICCAAKIGGIGYFNKIPADILDNNNLILSNILNVLKQMRPKDRPHLTYMSSSMVFESATKFPCAESDLSSTIIPISAYGFQKLAGEFYCTAFAAQHGIRYTIVRPFNAVGPEKPDPNFVGYSHVLPDLVCKIKNGQGGESSPLEILGAGTQVRHYTDVREIAEGIILAAHHPHAINNDFNIAIDRGHTVLEVAELISSVMRPGEKLFIKNTDPFPCDVQFRAPDVTKTESILGWRAKVYLEDNIEEIVNSVLELI